MNVQKLFLQQVKDRLPDYVSLVDELSQELHISTDSAYRRIRGETNLSFYELYKLSVKYSISLDQLFANTTHSVVFNYRGINHETFNFEAYLSSIVENLEMINRFHSKQLIYMAKDVPIFHLFQFPEFTAFKIFFWCKTLLQFPDYEGKFFSIDAVPAKEIQLARKIHDMYISTPSQEMWSYESINVNLAQIEFYWECGMFENSQMASVLLDQLEEIILHIKEQASRGFKFLPQQAPQGEENNYQLYVNEVVISDNTILFKMEDLMVTHITTNVFTLLTTTNQDFCSYTYKNIKNIMKNSTLISVHGEKTRNKFFSAQLRKIDHLRDKVTR